MHLAALLLLSLFATPTPTPAVASAAPVAATAVDGGIDIVIVRADPGFPPPVPLGLLPQGLGDGGGALLWPKDLIDVATLGPTAVSDAYTQAKQAFDAALYPQAMTILDVAAQAAPLSVEARYLRALVLYKAGLSAEAARELIAVADLLPPLAPRCLYLAGQALEDQRAYGTAAEVYAKASQVGLDSAIRRDAQLGEARMRAGSPQSPSDLTRAEAIWTELGQLSAPTSGFGRDLGAEALIAHAQLEERRGQGAKAAHLYKEVWLKHPLSSHAQVAEEKLAAMAPALTKDPAADLARAEMLLAANRNAPAIAALTPLAASLKLKPHSAVACEAHFALGKALKKQRRHSDALKEMTSVLEACTAPEDADLRARTLYLAGQSAAVIDPAKAKKLFGQLADAYPDNSFADDALFFAADVEMKNLGEPDVAAVTLAKLVELYPHGDYASEARFRLFWLAKEAGTAPAGAPHLAALKKSAPVGAPREPEPILRARYWLAQTESDAGELTSLAKEWPAHYYGDLARNAVTGAPESAVATGSALPAALHAGTLLQDPNFVTGLALLRLGFTNAADEELLRVDRQGVTGPTGRAEPLLVLALALHRAGDPRAAHALAKLLIESDDDFTPQPDAKALLDRAALTRLLFDVAYPRAFRPQIEKWATAAKIPPDLLQGLMREESALDPQALSGAGAIGLCQLMPTTGKRLAKKVGLGSVTVQQLQDPDLNIRLGAVYLGDLLKRYQGRQPLAVAAYNAGEGAVDKWLAAAPKDQPLDAFVEDIPIAETRHYVKRVLTSEAVYRTLPADLPLVARAP